MKILISILFAVFLMVGWLSPPLENICEDQSASDQPSRDEQSISNDLSQGILNPVPIQIEPIENFIVEIENHNVVKARLVSDYSERAESSFTINKNDELYHYSWNIQHSFLREQYRRPVLYPLSV